MAQIICRAAFPPQQNTGNSGSQRGHTASSRNTLTHSTHTFHTAETLVFDNALFLFISFILLGIFHFSVNNLTSMEPSITNVENEEKQLRTLQVQPNNKPFFPIKYCFNVLLGVAGVRRDCKIFHPSCRRPYYIYGNVRTSIQYRI